MWGARDPGKLFAYKQADASGQQRRSVPIDQDMQLKHVRQMSEGSVRSGARKGTRRINRFWRRPNAIVFILVPFLCERRCTRCLPLLDATVVDCMS